MEHERAVIFLSGMMENVGSSVEGIYFLVLEWCEIGLVRGVLEMVRGMEILIN